MVYIMSGGVVAYKTRFQDTIALSSTEAEFFAASDAGKLALYVRSILHNLGLHQKQATVIYENNMGA